MCPVPSGKRSANKMGRENWVRNMFVLLNYAFRFHSTKETLQENVHLLFQIIGLIMAEAMLAGCWIVTGSSRHFKAKPPRYQPKGVHVLLAKKKIWNQPSSPSAKQYGPSSWSLFSPSCGAVLDNDTPFASLCPKWATSGAGSCCTKWKGGGGNWLVSQPSNPFSGSPWVSPRLTMTVRKCWPLMDQLTLWLRVPTSHSFRVPQIQWPEAYQSGLRQPFGSILCNLVHQQHDLIWYERKTVPPPTQPRQSL